jgi:hypothetical protein
MPAGHIRQIASKEPLALDFKKIKDGFLHAHVMEQKLTDSYLSNCFTSPMAQTATETSMSSASSIIRLENLSVKRPRVGTLSSTS